MIGFELFRTLSICCFTLWLLAPASPPPVSAEEPGPACSNLLGDWAGLRPALAQAGISTALIVDNDLFLNTRGGPKTGGVNLGLVDWSFELDTDRAGMWQNGALTLNLLGTYGGNPSQFGGDIQGQDNIEAFSTVKIYRLWYEHQFYDGRLSFLFGLYDFDGEFDVTNYAAGLINPSF